MAKSAITTAPAPRLQLREYDVHLEGWPRLRLEALSEDSAELAYRECIGLKRRDLRIGIVDVSAQRERNNGLTDAEAKLQRGEEQRSRQLQEEKRVAAERAQNEQLERSARDFLASLDKQRAAEARPLQEMTA